MVGMWLNFSGLRCPADGHAGGIEGGGGADQVAVMAFGGVKHFLDAGAAVAIVSDMDARLLAEILRMAGAELRRDDFGVASVRPVTLAGPVEIFPRFGRRLCGCRGFRGVSSTGPALFFLYGNPAALPKHMKTQRNVRAHKLAKFLSVSPFFTHHTTDPGIAAARALAVWIPIATLVCGIAGYLITN